MIGKVLGAIGGIFAYKKGSGNVVSDIALAHMKKDEGVVYAVNEYLKSIDKNGMMRRSISSKIINLFVLYFVTMITLIFMQSFGYGSVEGTTKAIESLKELFLPVLGLTGTIVTASFGVNGINSLKGK